MPSGAPESPMDVWEVSRRPKWGVSGPMRHILIGARFAVRSPRNVVPKGRFIFLGTQNPSCRGMTPSLSSHELELGFAPKHQKSFHEPEVFLLLWAESQHTEKSPC